MDIADIQSKLRAFAAERDWDQYHSPKNLSMALAVESSELLEIFQWLTPEESTSINNSLKKQAVGDELADIFLYLARICDVMEVDLEQAVARKIAKNAQKYPAAGANTPKSMRDHRD